MGLERVRELKVAVNESHHAIVAADGYPSAPARAALYPPLDLRRNRALPGGLLLEELELPPLVHLLRIRCERLEARKEIPVHDGAGIPAVAG